MLDSSFASSGLCLSVLLNLPKISNGFYTSKASFVDRDYLPTFGEKSEGWKESGRRVKRDLYRTGLLNWYINADCNGAANILRKVATMLGLCLNGVGRGTFAAPQRVNLNN